MNKLESTGQRIRAQRKKLGYTQRDIAMQIGVSTVAVTQWETDVTSPKGENLVRLASILLTKSDYLVGVAEQPEINPQVGERIKLARERKGYSIGDLRRALKLKPEDKRIEHYESGLADADIKELARIGAALDTSGAWLMFGSIDENAKPLMEGFDLWDSNTALNDDEVELPFFTEVELSAGSGTTYIRENQGPKLRFAKSTLKKQGVDPAHAACVKVSGNSMEPVLPDGATVGINTAETSISDGKMFAIDHDGMLRVKTLYRLPGGGIRLRSFNSEEFQDEIYSGDDALKIRIIGRVFWYSVLI